MAAKAKIKLPGFVYLFFALATAMIGHHIHHSLFWAVMDFIFWPIAWCKWLVCQQVNLTIIKATFSFFLQ